MSLTVGTNTYITLIEADTYVNDNYVSTSSKYISWDMLSDGDKEIFLKNACKKIDRQVLKGIKAINTQILEFPRALYTDYSIQNFPNTNIRYNSDWVVETEVNQNVKDSQIEETLAIMINGDTANQRIDLQSQGVKSFRLGNLSETYGGTVKSGTRLFSVEAKELLRYWLNGSVMIR